MMNFSIENDQNNLLSTVSPTVIKIIGCGGGGSSAVNRLIESGVSDVEYIVLNTDLQALNVSRAEKRIAIGQKLTGGLGAGGNPAVGENAAKEDTEVINNILQGSNMVIITAGMGGGTGTGSAPIVAKLAKDAGALTIAVVTTPFGFEAQVRMSNALEGIRKLRESVDSLIVIPNEQIMKSLDKQKRLTYREAFRLADEVLCSGVKGISEIITKPGDVNLDFADVKSVMKDQGEAILGVGIGEGDNRAVDAAQMAISNPMLESRQIDGATKILVNITSSGNLGIEEVEEIVNNIKASASSKVEVFFGLVTDESIGDKVSVTVIATGFNADVVSSFGEAEAEQEPDDDFMSLGTFENVMSGRSPLAARNEEQEEIKPKTSSIGGFNFSSFGSSNMSERDEEREEEKALSAFEQTLRNSASSRRGIEIPSGYKINSDDLEQPAVFRNLNGLKRGIELTED